MEDEIIKIINSQFNLATILFIVFIVVVIIIYIIVWIPILKGLDDEIIRTKKMLNIIPIQILDKIDSLKTEKD
jgi:ABC-type bacteriocin/lantibiotic exporter with double-glycine peptidase domain